MKRLLIGVAALLAVAPGIASANGYVGLGYSTNDETDTDTTSITGAALLSPNIQVDGGYASLEGDVDAWNVGGHLFTRNDAHLIGVYVGYNTFDNGGDSIDEWIVAGQGQMYFDRTTLSGDVSYASSEFITDIDQWAVDAEVRHFVTDNFSIQGNVGYANADGDGGSIDGTTYGVGAEWQLSTVPISIHGGWQQIDVDGNNASSLGVGVRWNWGGTLLERNRSGAGLGAPNGFFERFLTGDLTPR